jgi:glycosyltransferase involved in cell wall biosynthesis
MSAPASVSLIIGPGHHGPRLRDALLGAGLLRQVVQTSPSLRVSEWRGAGPGPKLVVTWDAAWTGALSRGVWGVWRRLPRLGLRETPRAPLFALWDLLASAALQPCDLLIGWCGVSLYALRRARARTVLEHPTGHVRSWMARARAEYRRHGGHRAAGPAGYGLLPEGLCRRMEEEVACADQVMVLSRQAADTFLAAGVPAGKLVLVTPGVDAGRFHPGPRQGAQDRARDVLRVLYVGRLELLKGLAYLLEAFSRLRGLPCELWLCGRVLPEVGPLLRRHRREGLRVLGPVPPERMPAIYRQADVLVMPSLHEGLALVVLEAMATGLPVIATPESGAADVLEDGVQGLLVPARDPEALAARLEHLYHHEGRRRAMGAAGRARVLERLTWGHYHARLLQALRTG